MMSLTDCNEMTSSSPAIALRALSFEYTAGKKALENISLTVQKGEQVALLGQNGSGKTTLVKQLNGLLRPTTGQVEILGTPATQKTVAQLSHMVALQFQNPDNQICKSTVWEEVAFGGRNLHYSEEKVQACTESALAMLNLHSQAHKNPYDLSFSERKRLSIASVLAMDTEILILDEPTAGLDAGEQALLVAALKELSRKGKTTILISHDMDFVAENADRIIFLNAGEKQFDGTVQDFFYHHAASGKCGMALPQVYAVSSHFALTLDTITPECFIETFAQAQNRQK